jgi:hypothetical protein
MTTHDNNSPPGIAGRVAPRGDLVKSDSDRGRMWPKNPDKRAAVPNLLCRAARTLLGLLGRPRAPARTEAEPELYVTLPPEADAALIAADAALAAMHDRARAALSEALAIIDTASSQAQCVAAIARGQVAGNSIEAAASALACLDAIREAQHHPISEAEFDRLSARLDAALAVVAAAIPVETMIQ